MGLRIWIGLEREGFAKGVKTLFVETDNLTSRDAEKIVELCTQLHINRVYLGAGKINLVCYDTSAIESLHRKDFEVIIECAFDYRILYNPILDWVSQLILRIDCNEFEVSNKQLVKIDNGKKVCIYRKPCVNDLDDVVNGIYTQTDKLVWDE